MTQIVLIMYSLDEGDPEVSRKQLRAFARGLNLPPGPVGRRTRSASFIAACQQIVHPFTAEDGSAQEIHAGQQVTKPEFVSFSVLGPSGKLAEIKYFVPRRTETGLVADSHAVKTIVRKNLPQAERAAVQEWLEVVQEAFESGQDNVAWHTMRRLARTSLQQLATPVRRQRCTYFAYEEHLAQVQDVARFLRLCAPTGQVMVFPLGQDMDRASLGPSADEWLLAGASTLQEEVEAWVMAAGDPRRRTFAKALGSWRDEAGRLMGEVGKHEARLGVQLAATRACLAMSEEMTRALNSSAHLLPVTSS